MDSFPILLKKSLDNHTIKSYNPNERVDMDNKPVDAHKTFSWIGKHNSAKKITQACANLDKARAVAKAMRADGKKIGGWPLGKKRGKRVKK